MVHCVYFVVSLEHFVVYRLYCNLDIDAGTVMLEQYKLIDMDYQNYRSIFLSIYLIFFNFFF